MRLNGKYIKKNWSVNGSRSSKLIVFDLDDTIVCTPAQIKVIKNNKVVRKLSSSEFNNYIPKQGEWFDYSEFLDPNLLAKGRFTKYWKTLKREYRKGTHISIVTARHDPKMIRAFLLKNKIDIKDELVFAVGDPEFMYKGTIPQRKAKVIKLLSRLGYNTMVFFDDNDGNLAAVKSMENDHLKIYTVKV